MSEESLILRCLRQDKLAWDEFVYKYSALVRWAIEQRLSRFGYNFSEEDVSDIHQDVFFSIWREKKLAQLKDKNKIVAWLTMVAGNKAMDYFKLIKRRSAASVECIFEETPEEEETALLSNKTLEEIYSNDIIHIVNETLEEFSRREKIILKFNLLYQKTHQEIAEMLSIPHNTVSTVISRSKEKLKERLIDKGIKDF
jgi:RNA polymerase sigma-70 factor (ECF subfamily)